MSLPTFFTSEQFSAGQVITLGEVEARHIRVRRLEVGERVGVLDGLGTRGEGVLVRLAKRHAAVHVERAGTVEPPGAVHLLLPIADRDRMLWLAEKATELEATSWRPVNWKHSRSVSPRGEGPTFQQKVKARMTSALEQSNGAWLPAVYPEATVERAIAATSGGLCMVLDGGGAPIVRLLADALRGSGDGGDSAGLPSITIAVGPEGGLDGDELAQLASVGFKRASLGDMILRFETAAVGALAIARAALGAAVPTAVAQEAPDGR